MANRVADRFPNHRLGLIGERAVDHRQWTHELNAGAQPRVGKLGYGRIDSLPEPSDTLRCSVQVINGGPDFLYNVLQIVYHVRESLLHFRITFVRDSTLQSQANREEPLDDMVMEVTGDTIPVGQYVEFAHPTLRSGQLPSQRGLVGERGHHLELFVGESPWTALTQHNNDTRYGTSGPQRQQQRRTCVGQFVQAFQIDPVDPSRNAVDEDLPQHRARHRNRSPNNGSHSAADCFNHQQLPTSAAGMSSSTGTATRAASAAVSLSASAATSRNTVAGSVPDNNSVAMSRVASIHD